MTPVWKDLFDVLVALALSPVVFLFPGYTFGYLTNVLGFRQASERLSRSIVLSLCIAPILTYALMRYGSSEVAVWYYVINGLFCVALFLITSERETLKRAFSYRVLKLTCLGILVILIVGLMLIDFKIGDQLIRPLMTFDYVKHFTVTGAISRTSLPPANPSLYLGEPLPLFYYYFWFMLCSILDLLGGEWVGPKAAVHASIYWSGIALCAILHIYLRVWGEKVIKGFKPQLAVWGFVLLLVTGLDVLPVFIQGMRSFLTSSSVFPGALWWNEIVATWLSVVVWVPHHLGSFVVSLFAFMLILEKGTSRFSRGIAGFVAALALASSLGMSIWVSIVTAWCLVAWFIAVCLRRWYADVRFLLLVGSVSLLFALPFILDIQQAKHIEGVPIIFHVRPFAMVNIALDHLNPMIVHLVSLLLLPINYIIELGFLCLGGALYYGYRKSLGIPLNKEEFFLLVVFCASLFFSTFFRSAIANNDLGWRGFMFVQFILLLVNIPLLAHMAKKFDHPKFIVLPTSLGLAKGMLVLSTFFMLLEVYANRFHPWDPVDPGTVQIRQAYEWIDENLNEDAVIQHNPDIHVEYFSGLYGNRQVAMADEIHAQLYGINEEMYTQNFRMLSRLFEKEIEHEEAQPIVKHFGIDAIFVKTSDVLWDDEETWLNTYPMVYSSSCCRLYVLKDPDHVLKENASFSLTDKLSR